MEIWARMMSWRRFLKIVKLESINRYNHLEQPSIWERLDQLGLVEDPPVLGLAGQQRHPQPGAPRMFVLNDYYLFSRYKNTPSRPPPYWIDINQYCLFILSLFHFSVSGSLLRAAPQPLSFLSTLCGPLFQSQNYICYRGENSLITEYRWRICNDQNHDTYRILGT